jgi:hypothetical protein
MARSTRKTTAREEFDKSLDALNARQSKELQQAEKEQQRVEQLLTQHENTLDEVETRLCSKEEEDKGDNGSSTHCPDGWAVWR